MQSDATRGTLGLRDSFRRFSFSLDEALKFTLKLNPSREFLFTSSGISAFPCELISSAAGS